MPADCAWCHPEDGFRCFMCGEANGCEPLVRNVHDIKPPGAEYIGRGTPWGNPFPIGNKYGGRDEVIARFYRYARLNLKRHPTWLEPLRGKDLVCHCAPRRCHAEVILYYLRRTANGRQL